MEEFETLSKRIFKNLLLIFLLLIALLAAILLFNTFSLKSRQVAAEALPPVKIDSEAAAGRLGQAIRFQTVSLAEAAEPKAEEFKKFHDFLQSAFPNLHSALGKEIVGGHSLLYKWPGSDPNLKPVILMAHQDVVPVDEATISQWMHPPFSGDVAEGFIWGRGSFDDKGNLMAMLEALEMLIAQGHKPQRTIYLAFGHDEELGGKNGAVQIAGLLKERGIQAEFVIDEGGPITEGVIKGVEKPVALIGTAEKGSLSLQLTVEDAGGHSSQPPRHTAIGILSRAVTRLEENPLPGGIRGISQEMFERLAPEMPFRQRLFLANLWLFRPLVERQLSEAPTTNASLRTTTAVTIFNSGIKVNVLPNKATATVNFRTMPGDTAESITEFAEKTINDERVKIIRLGDSSREASAVSDPNSPNFKLLEKTIRQTFPDTLATPFLFIGGTDSRHFESISPNIYRLTPLKAGQDDLKRFHGVNEKISVEGYAQAIGFYCNLIKNSGNQ